MPFGTMVRITDQHTGNSVTCRVSDRGPAKRTGRVIDLSRGCASALGIVRRGTALVNIEVVNQNELVSRY
jgi:Lipoproteins